MNCTDEYDTYVLNYSYYSDGLLLIGGLVNMLFFYIINSNINGARREIRELKEHETKILLPPNYASA